MIGRRQLHFFLTAILFSFIFLFIPKITFAADLRVSTDKSQYQVGDVITARITLNSGDQSSNAVSGILAFPADKLKIIALSKSGSIINLWVKEPSYSASSINFEGIILNPGYNSNGGRIVTATFTAKSPGAVSLYFSDGQILANDGNGTNILKNLIRVSFTIIPKAIPTEKAPEIAPAPVIAGNPPPAPTIISLTNPDENKWYKEPTPQLSWVSSNDIMDVSYILDREISTVPPATPMGLMSYFKPQNPLPDGIWYFHLRLRNASGWGPSATYSLKIDSTAPEMLAIDEIKTYSALGRAKFVFDSTDKLSGLDHFEFMVDGGDAQTIVSAGLHNYFEAPLLAPGRHLLTVRAYDQAGNIAEKVLEFRVQSDFLKTILDFLSNNIMSTVSILLSLTTMLFMLLFLIHLKRERNHLPK